jgi:hypothetical protein
MMDNVTGAIVFFFFWVVSVDAPIFIDVRMMLSLTRAFIGRRLACFGCHEHIELFLAAWENRAAERRGRSGCSVRKSRGGGCGRESAKSWSIGQKTNRYHLVRHPVSMTVPTESDSRDSVQLDVCHTHLSRHSQKHIVDFPCERPGHPCLSLSSPLFRRLTNGDVRCKLDTGTRSSASVRKGRRLAGGGLIWVWVDHVGLSERPRVGWVSAFGGLSRGRKVHTAGVAIVNNLRVVWSATNTKLIIGNSLSVLDADQRHPFHPDSRQ